VALAGGLLARALFVVEALAVELAVPLCVSRRRVRECVRWAVMRRRGLGIDGRRRVEGRSIPMYSF
jgi:hypothetical protein